MTNFKNYTLEREKEKRRVVSTFAFSQFFNHVAISIDDSIDSSEKQCWVTHVVGLIQFYAKR